MKIIFIGNVIFSEKMLKKILELKGDVIGVITKRNSSFNSDFCDISYIAKENNIDYLYVENINEIKNIEWIKNKQPDIIFCFGFSNLIKKEILSIPKMGVVGFHPTKLPQNRGRHPIIWSLVLGLKKSASTFFFMDEGADSGDILSQKEFEISYKDSAKTLYEKIINIALEQVELFLPKLIKKEFSTTKQDNSKTNYWRKRTKKDGEIDFRMDSYSIYNLVRALTKPYIGAHLIYKGEEIKIWKIQEEKYNTSNIEPGKVLLVENGEIVIKCGNGAVRIIEHEFVELPKKGEYL
jgi:methionyl-tRNA formyltransferase